MNEKSPIPKISVVMPIYNEERFLDESMQSVLNQTFKDFEFIIINNCSEDNSLNIIKSYKDKRITFINNKKNLGTSKSINKGLKIARGKYIAIFCGDDVSHPKRLSVEFNYLENNPHIFLVGSSAVYINEHGKEIRRFRKYDNYKMLAWRLRKSCSIVLPSIMFRNEDIPSNSDKEDWDDYNFYFELLKKGKNLTNLPDFLVKHRVHTNSASVYDRKKYERSVDEVLEKFKELEDNTNFFNKIYYSIKLFFHYIRTRGEKRILTFFSFYVLVNFAFNII